MPVSAEVLAELSYLIYNNPDAPVKIQYKEQIIPLESTQERYTVLDFVEDATGYAGAILRDNFGNIILVHRGTEPDVDVVRDAFITDLMMGVVQLNNQIPAAEKLLLKAQALATDSGSTLTMTGHSLGGTITQILAAKYQVQGVTFNAYGAVGVNDTPEGGEGLVTNHVRATDIVGNAGVHFGAVVKYATASDVSAAIVPLKTLESLNFSTHAITSFFGTDSIESKENRERYEQSAYGYDMYAEYLRAQIMMAKAAFFVVSPPAYNAVSRWFKSVYNGAAAAQAFLGTGENDSFSGTSAQDLAKTVSENGVRVSLAPFSALFSRAMFVSMVGLLAAATLAGCERKYSPPDIHWKINPGEKYNVRLELESQNFQQLTEITGFAEYDISNFKVCVTRVFGAGPPQPSKRVPIEIKRISEKTFSISVYRNPLKDEDYYGMGLCKWVLRAIEVDFERSFGNLSVAIGSSEIRPGEFKLLCNDALNVCTADKISSEMSPQIEFSTGNAIISGE